MPASASGWLVQGIVADYRLETRGLCHKPWPRGIARHERVIAAIECDEPRSRVTAWQHPALLERHDAVVAANWELPEPSHGSGAVLPLAARQSDVRFVSH